MTTIHFLAPYHPPICIRRVACRLLPENWKQNSTCRNVPVHDDPTGGLDWSTISSNAIAKVLISWGIQ